VSVYCLDWLSSSVSLIGVGGSGLVTWSGTSSGSWGVTAVSLLLLLLVALMGTSLKGVAGLG